MKHKPARRNVLLTYDSDYSSSRRIVSGALRRISEMSDWDVTTLNFRNRGFLQSVRLLNDKQPFDGVITDLDTPLPEGLGKALTGVPVVFAAIPSADWTQFGCIADNEAIASAAVRTLLRFEPSHFAYVGARAHGLESSHSAIRERSFRRILADIGREVTTLFVDAPRLARHIADLPKPVGIFAYNDISAAKVLSECHAAGIRVPEQAAVIGVDNDPDICENTHPPLSSVDPDFEAAGRIAVETLFAVLEGRDRSQSRGFGIRGVVERETTQAVKTGSRMVAAIRDILRRRYDEKLSLGQIAGTLNISQRLLTMRFREVTGRTVHEELEEIRLEAARWMLESSAQPVKAIAAACGFPSLENFYRRYRRRYGETPRGRPGDKNLKNI